MRVPTRHSLPVRSVMWAIAGTAVVAVVVSAVALARTAAAPPDLKGSGLVVPPPLPGAVSLEPAASVRPADPASYDVSSAWVSDTAAASRIPAPAVRAYGDATLRMSHRDASCGLGWTTLAGLGWVESEQGTIGGRVVGADGRADRRILGPALDGVGDLAAIRAADGRWERAVGPLQFLPSTWAAWGADADGDGRADPQDLDDAAWAAARYLCASGSDLRTGAGWAAAIRSYNHSDTYVQAVFDAASAYAARTAPR
jgi:membrane-bound lytic murein transglycosylase B